MGVTQEMRDKMHIYLETAPESGVLKYRGESGENDNPESFSDKMAKQGIRTQVESEFQGLQIVLSEPDTEDDLEEEQ